ncbi:hypothetical protein EW145_g1390 [Phellinidium pouzarii]|uniref:Zn(2)-C6 fungal-type domain-containing protein n=1 Tax=Phellinidium pouzarii TaxID=167371 RepID=A0A4S4LEQ3_9AGAM|nr:hypothetical protein EW145_g1390 [Phellinidium pouzarii]
MPVDRHHASHPSRRISTDDATRQREQELRRARGEIACVECQRLKLRCDRKVPCASCIRRNRAAMCPNGHAWSDQETRTLLSDTAQLHRKLSEMSQRIRQLEDALEISHSANSSSSHPLLREELLSIKRCIVPTTPAVIPEPEGEPEGEYVEALGTMSISDRGVSRFIGRSGGGESLLFLGNDSDQAQQKVFADESFPQLLSRRSDSWLLMPPNANKVEVLLLIEARMPPLARASSLCEAYLENFSWILRAVERPQIFEELLPFCYRNAGPGGAARIGCTIGATAAHELALLLMVFATGALADLTLAPYNDEAERYYQMALAALSVTQVLGAASLPVVQAVALMGAYNAHCGRNNTLDLAGSLFNVAANLAISMGLHRDVAKWNVSAETADRRRTAFWELFTNDCWHNLANGKPSSFVLKYCDCKYPEGNATVVGKNRQKETSHWMDRHTFSRQVYAVSELFCGVQPVRYAQVLDLDRKISEHITPPHLQIPPEGSSMEADGPLLIMQRMISSICTEGLLMYIHRGYFAKALLKHPQDPLLSPYAHSFLSAHRAALSLIKVVREHFAHFPNLVSRFWSLWSHAFSATVIIGSIVIKSRDPDMVRAALIELDLGVRLFEDAAQQADRAKRSLPTLIRLREKAHNSARALSNPHPVVADGRPVGEAEDELLIFTGKDRLIKPKVEPTEIPLSALSTPDSSGSTSTTSSSRAPTLPPLAESSSAKYSFIARAPTTLNSGTPQNQNQSQQDYSHGSPGDLALLADTDGDEGTLAMSLDLPGAFDAWSAWSDQEALLINYLSSGADFNLAQSAAFAGEPDPGAFMWSDMSNSNSPDTQTAGQAQSQPQGLNGSGPDGTLAQSQQQQQLADAEGTIGSGTGTDDVGYASLFPGLDVQEPSPFVHGSGDSMSFSPPSQAQSQFPPQSGAWEMYF